MSEEYKEGGEQGYVGDGPNFRLDDFVGRIVEDPSQPPELLLLSGYLGASSEEGHVRLYLDEELGRYVEIPEKAIRHTQELSPEQSPLGGSLVWLDRGAEVLHGSATEERRKATFLQGQIAQDYIGGAAGYGTGGGGEGARQEGGGEAGAALPQTRLLGCQSAINPCIPPTEFGPNCQSVFQVCRTLTGIFCTRFGPGCRRTLFEPACTSFGPNCHTVLVNQCQPSVFFPCFTQNKFDCQESGFVPCNPPIDFTIWQEPPGGQANAFAAARAGGVGGVGGVGGIGQRPPSLFGDCTSKLVFPCPSIHICPSQFGPICPSQLNLCFTIQPDRCPPPVKTSFGCVFSVDVACPPSVAAPCPTQTGPRCLISQIAVCGVTQDCTFQTARCGFDPGFGAQDLQGTSPTAGETRFCPTQVSSCKMATQGVPCASAVDACPTRFGCETQRGCPPEGGGGGGGGGGQGFAGEGFGGAQAAILQTQQAACFTSQFIRCASAVDACPTRFNCPSQLVACQSQYIKCPSALDACPTRFNCPSVNSPCITQDFSCETRGRCPSAVDACPTRFGCFETQAGCFQTQVCGVSQACFPGGGGGFNPGGGGFGGGGFGGGGF